MISFTPNGVAEVLPASMSSSDEVRGALTILTLAVALVVDAAGERDGELCAAGDRASAAIADALFLAAGKPAHELWYSALRKLAAFVEEAESGVLAYGSRDAMASLKDFISENRDLVASPSTAQALL